MISQRLANIVFAIIVVVACGWFAAIAQRFETSGLLATSGLPSKFFPQLVLGLTSLCAVAVAVIYALRGAAGGDRQKRVYTDAGEARRSLLVLAVAVACYLIWSKFGFLPMALVMGPMCLLAMGNRAPRTHITVLLLTAFVTLVFTRLLGIQLL